MLSTAMEKALNEQIQMEAEASHKYLAMASWCDKNGLEGCAQFMYQHADEERMHMMKLFHYINEAAAFAIVPTVQQPRLDYANIQELFEAAYQSELKVSAAIHALVDSAHQEKDRQTFNFLQWYVTEQLEEEVLFRKILDKFRLIGDGERALYFLDKEVETLWAAAQKKGAAKQ
ncbi:MAG: ferritin [Sphingobacteriales bacterium]|nr:ferritin [Sphingobacteriales bacterium]